MLSITDEKGQGLVEYALILVLIAIVVVVAVGAFGTELNNTFKFISDQIPGS